MSIGNDVVDLCRPEARGKAKDERFVRRVFNASEVDWIKSARDPDRMLWMMWAAKEAAFKIIRKQNGGALFAHRSYGVIPSSELKGGADPCVRVRGTVRAHEEGEGGGSTFPVEWEVTQRMVHCLAVSSAVDVWSVRAALSEVDQAEAARPPVRWSGRELLSARSVESREARLLAKRLALDAGLGPVEIVRNPGVRRLGPPLLCAAGTATPLEGWDLTLSHDGAFAAAALCSLTTRLTATTARSASQS